VESCWSSFTVTTSRILSLHKDFVRLSRDSITDRPVPREMQIQEQINLYGALIRGITANLIDSNFGPNVRSAELHKSTENLSL
jgi:hypothetical protein